MSTIEIERENTQTVAARLDWTGSGRSWTPRPAPPSLTIILEERENYWTALEDETGIFGAGPTQEVALDDLMQALKEHLDVLSRQDALSPELSAQLAYLRKRFN